jgi:hypothetical protein
MPDQPSFSCEVCSAKVSELRRGRCWGCYGRWVEARPVGQGAKCITCPERRRRVLRSVELFGTWHPMCFNCAGQLLTISPMPENISDLRATVSRERRRNDRRFGKSDGRVFRYERRVGQRRDIKSDSLEMIDDDMIIEVSTSDSGMDFEDMTRIHEQIVMNRFASGM